MRAPPMPVPPPLLQDCIPGELLRSKLRHNREFHHGTCFKHNMKIRQNNVQGTILRKSNIDIFDI